MKNILEDYFVMSAEHLDAMLTEWFVRHFSYLTNAQDKHTAGYARAHHALFDLKAQLTNNITKSISPDANDNVTELAPISSICVQSAEDVNVETKNLPEPKAAPKAADKPVIKSQKVNNDLAIN